MPSPKRLQVLVAMDGSPASKAAVDTVVRFPWSDSTRVGGVVAVGTAHFRLQSKSLDEVLKSSLDQATGSAHDVLTSRWPGAEVAVLDEAPIEAILGEARRVHAGVIALGWRGHGTFRRLLAGSVSRAVAARANCAVLVARTAPKVVNRFVIGYDDGPNSRRAVQLLSRLVPGRDSKVVLVTIIEPVNPLAGRAARLPAAVRSTVRSRIAAVNAERLEKALATLETAATRLRNRGWNTETELLSGSPLPALLTAARVHDGDVLIVGARETSGVERALLGSVAEGVLNNSRMPVLIVR